MSVDRGSRFQSRLGLFFAALGIAVGTGNFWRFPRIAAAMGAEHGAGAFLVVWVGFLFAWSVPLIVAELAIGRFGRLGVVGSFTRVGGPRAAWMGAFVALVATSIMFYYSVVAGYCLGYTGRLFAGPLPATPAESLHLWNTVSSGPSPFVTHGAAMGLASIIVARGVRSIERASQWLVPALLVIAVAAALRAVTLPGAAQGLASLVAFDARDLLEPRLWLEALTQNAWDTGAGWGLLLTYGAYMPARTSLGRQALWTGVGNNLVSLVAATMVFGTVFACWGHERSHAEIMAVLAEEGPASTGLTFVWLPQLFAELPFGRPLAVAFFAGLFVAALTSLVAMVELATRILVDAGVRRSNAVWGVGTAGVLLGLPSAYEARVLANQDFVWGVALILSGALIAQVLRRFGIARFWEVAIATEGIAGPHRSRASAQAFRLAFVFALRVLIPLEAFALVGFWLWQSAVRFAPERWFDPFEPYSVMTCLAQWSAGFVLAWVVGPRLATRAMLDRDEPRPNER